MIEWNTTARRGTPYVKTFIEERDLSVMLMVDLSGSMDIKRQSMYRIASVVTTLADYLDDRIGCLGFAEKVEFYLPPTRKQSQPERILHLLLQQPRGVRKTSLTTALGFLGRVLKKHSIVFIVSDFLDRNFQSSLLPLARKHELVGVYLYHPVESGLATAAVIDCTDPESGNRYLLDAADAKTRENYRNFFDEQKKRVARTFARAGADLLMVPAGRSASLQLIEFLRRRQSARAALQLLLPAELPDLLAAMAFPE